MLSDMWYDLRRLILPPVCPICGGALPRGEAVVCSLCEATAPLTHLWLEEENPLRDSFGGLMPVCKASAFVWYVEGSPWRRAIHRFKYGNMWRTAYDLGRWYGACLKQSGLYDDVDVIIPVPLHWWRRLTRGYNQSEYLADGIARELGVEVDRRSAIRYRYNKSQVSQHHHSERWDNVEGIFRLRRTEHLRGKHILLVDDVLTTGATVISLGTTILREVEGARLSVAVLATPRHTLHIEG